MTIDNQFRQNLDQIQKLQKDSGSIFDFKRGKFLSYNPILERRKFEELKERGMENDFYIYGIKQIETTLRERLQTAKSPVNYLVDDKNNLRNELLPDEPFLTVLQRGIAYRKDLGSVEQKREQDELLGFTKIQERLLGTKTVLGSKMIVISGPGTVEETSYPHNFVDIYEKVKSVSGDISIKMTRLASEMDYPDYVQKALLFNPKYFDGYEEPIDAWFLKHPIPVAPQAKFESSEDIFEKVFKKKVDTISEQEFTEIFEACMPFVVNYINILCQDNFDQTKVALAFNAVLNKADYFKDKRKSIPVFSSIHQEALWLGLQAVREVSAGCGLSSGFGINSLQNSVATFGLKDKYGDRTFECPRGHKNIRPHDTLIENCQECGVSVRCN